MSANNLENEIQFEFITNAIKEIWNNNKQFSIILLKQQQLIWILAKLMN